jgi:hypothetical protein
MLDRLEVGIAELRARVGDVAPLNGGTGRRTVSKAKKPRKRPAKKKTPEKVQAAAAAAGEAGQPETGEVQPPARVTGKRQALGRSLLRLRKSHGGTPGPH